MSRWPAVTNLGRDVQAREMLMIVRIARSVVVAAGESFMKSQLCASTEASAAAVTFPAGWEVPSCLAMLVPRVLSCRELPLAGPAGVHVRVR